MTDLYINEISLLQLIGLYWRVIEMYIDVYGMEMNVEKTKVMRILRQPFPVKNYDRPKTTRECGIF